MFLGVFSVVFLVLTFSNGESLAPKRLYQVYVDDQVVGQIKSKKELEEYFNQIYHEIEYIYDSKISSKANQNWDNDYEHYHNLRGNVYTIQKYLESIDNAKPSEALECLEKMYDGYCMGYGINDEQFKIIKQTLIKAQEQEKVLEIIKEHLTFKDSGIEEYTDVLTNQKVKKHCIKIKSKDTGATIHIHLDTQEEFDLLKRW